MHFLRLFIVKFRQNIKEKIRLLSQLRDTLGLFLFTWLIMVIWIGLFYKRLFLSLILLSFDHSQCTDRHKYVQILNHICGLLVQRDSVYHVNLHLLVDRRWRTRRACPLCQWRMNPRSVPNLLPPEKRRRGDKIPIPGGKLEWNPVKSWLHQIIINILIIASLSTIKLIWFFL